MVKTYNMQKTCSKKNSHKVSPKTAHVKPVFRAPTERDIIEHNRHLITVLTSGNNFTRLNNLHWIAQELRKETLILYQAPQEEKEENWVSVSNVQDAWNYIISNQQITISVSQICKLHTILTKGTDIPGGAIRFDSAYIERLQLSAPDYFTTIQRLDDIAYNISNSRIDPLTRAIHAHYDLIATQPFNDFNKRTARMVMNWVLVQNGYRPILFNKPADKKNYMMALLQCAKGNRKAYNQYMYRCLKRTQNDIIKVLSNRYRTL